jgi:hypothetical protein
VIKGKKGKIPVCGAREWMILINHEILVTNICVMSRQDRWIEENSLTNKLEASVWMKNFWQDRKMWSKN